MSGLTRSDMILVDCPTQLICISDIYMSTDKYKRHSSFCLCLSLCICLSLCVVTYLQSQGGNFSSMLDVISHWKTTDNHVGIANGFNLMMMVMVLKMKIVVVLNITLYTS